MDTRYVNLNAVGSETGSPLFALNIPTDAHADRRESIHQVHRAVNTKWACHVVQPKPSHGRLKQKKPCKPTYKGYRIALQRKVTGGVFIEVLFEVFVVHISRLFTVVLFDELFVFMKLRCGL